MECLGDQQEGTVREGFLFELGGKGLLMVLGHFPAGGNIFGPILPFPKPGSG